MESWRKVWREGIQPQVSTIGLITLYKGLKEDGESICQGATTLPPPLQGSLELPVEATDAIGYVAWKAYGADTVGKVEEFFAKLCYEAEQKLGEPAAVRYFIWWYDTMPMDVVRTDLMEEITRELGIRQCAEPVRTIGDIRETTIV
jgi:hypothetical protein